MNEVLEQLRSWKSEGTPAALATVVRTEKSAPLSPGAMMGVSAKGDVVGSVSGGCVEPAVYEEATRILETGGGKLLTYGISDEQAFEVGLSCGGTIHVFVERMEW